MQTYKRRLSISDLKGNGTNDLFDYLPKVKDYFLTDSVRGGLEELIRHLLKDGKGKVLLPAFIAEGVIKPFRNRKVKVVFYKLNQDLSPDIQDIEQQLIEHRDVRFVVAVHYFGFPQDFKFLRQLCDSRKMILFEDCVHALFSKDEQGNYLGSTGDISFFSLPKVLPTPDGGVFFINNPAFSSVIDKIKYHRSIAGMLMVWFHLWFLFIKKYEVSLNYSLLFRVMNFFTKALYSTYYFLLNRAIKPQRISNLTLRILKNLDYESIIKSRQEHIQQLNTVIGDHKELMFPRAIHPNSMLTGVPIITEHASELRTALINNNIECLTYKRSWFLIPEPRKLEFRTEYDFFHNHLLLPIHENNTDISGTLSLVLRTFNTTKHER